MAKKKKVSKKLSKLAGAWKDAEPTTSKGFKKAPDGLYVAKLQDIQIEEAKSGSMMGVVYTELASGDQEGIEERIFYMLDTDEGPGYFKGFLDIIGVDYSDDIEELQNELDVFMEDNPDLHLDVNIVTNKDFRNIYVNGLVDADDVDLDGEDDDDSDDEEDDNNEEEDDEEEDGEDDEDDDEDDEPEPAPKKKKKKKKVVAKKKAAPKKKAAKKKKKK